MKRLIMTFSITLVLMASVALSVQAQGWGDNFDRFRAKSCTQGMLKGDYGLLLHGTIVDHPMLPNGRFAALGVVSFDGAGSYTTQGVTNTNGLLTAYGPNDVIPSENGTYTVNSDCTGLLKGGPLGFDYRISLADDGSSYQVVFMPQEGMSVKAGVTGFAQRVGILPTGNNPWVNAKTPECTAGMVLGIYSLCLEGFVNDLPSITAGPFNSIGVFIGDGESRLAAVGENLFNGVPAPMEPDYSFTIAANGWGKITGPNNFYFVLVNGGKQMLLLGAYPEGVNYAPYQGAVLYGLGKKM